MPRTRRTSSAERYPSALLPLPPKQPETSRWRRFLAATERWLVRALIGGSHHTWH